MIYENPNILYVEPLEINGLNPNFIVLSDNSGFGGGFVESGDGTLSYFENGGKGKYCNPSYIEVVSLFSSSLQSSNELNATITTRDERRAFFYAECFTEVCVRDPIGKCTITLYDRVFTRMRLRSPFNGF